MCLVFRMLEVVEGMLCLLEVLEAMRCVLGIPYARGCGGYALFVGGAGDVGGARGAGDDTLLCMLECGLCFGVLKFRCGSFLVADCPQGGEWQNPFVQALAEHSRKLICDEEE